MIQVAENGTKKNGNAAEGAATTTLISQWDAVKNKNNLFFRIFSSSMTYFRLCQLHVFQTIVTSKKLYAIPQENRNGLKVSFCLDFTLKI
jgi:hypothetical protein